MDEKEREYMNYALSVIKDKADDILSFIEIIDISAPDANLIDTKTDVDPVKLTMELEPLQDALNAALNQFYRRYPVRRYPVSSYQPYYQSYQPNKN